LLPDASADVFYKTATVQACSGDEGMGGARPRPATRWIRVVSMASARVIAGRMVVSRRASIDVPAPGGPSKSTLWSERRHQL
jgi:hypothetical protein